VSRPFAVCVFCASGPVPAPYLALASDVGTALAARGWSVVSGGGRVSMMGAVARAAREGGARTVGVMPEALVAQEVADDQSDELLVVPDMRTRKGEMDARSDAVLALPGGLGTLEELFEAWTWRQIGLIEKPLALFNAQGFWDRLVAALAGFVAGGYISPASLDTLVVSPDLEGVLAGLAAQREKRC
jgi:uncharacterized protein (TIGR00730 family)